MTKTQQSPDLKFTQNSTLMNSIQKNITRSEKEESKKVLTKCKKLKVSREISPSQTKKNFNEELIKLLNSSHQKQLPSINEHNILANKRKIKKKRNLKLENKEETEKKSRGKRKSTNPFSDSSVLDLSVEQINNNSFDQFHMFFSIKQKRKGKAE